MTYPAIPFDQDTLAAARRKNAVSLVLFLLVAAAFVLRFYVSPQILDRFMHYTSEDGPLFEKVHVGTYAIFALTPFVLFGQPFTLRGDEIGKFRWLVRLLVWLMVPILYLIARGHAGSAGFIIDSYLVAAAAGLIVLAMDADYRRMLGELTLIMMIVSAAIAIAEVVTKHRFLPYDLEELQFRPIGLAGHPLVLGAQCATAMGFIPLTRWPRWLKVGLVLLVFIGCAASGARFALLTAAAEVPLMLMFLPWPGLSRRHARQAKAISLGLVLVGGAGLAAMLYSAGFLDRFSDSLSDGNFMVRVTVYRVFELAGWQNLIFGMSADDLQRIALSELHLPTIESTPVTIGLLLGLPLALFFTGLVARTLLRLLRGAPLAAWLGTIAFLLAHLSNNTLSTKTPVMASMIVLLLVFAVPRSREPAPPLRQD